MKQKTLMIGDIVVDNTGYRVREPLVVIFINNNTITCETENLQQVEYSRDDLQFVKRPNKHELQELKQWHNI